jgi:hypothetical protein
VEAGAAVIVVGSEEAADKSYHERGSAPSLRQPRMCLGTKTRVYSARPKFRSGGFFALHLVQHLACSRPHMQALPTLYPHHNFIHFKSTEACLRQ